MGFNGPYSLHLDLQKSNPMQWLGHREFTTDMHNYTDFSLPSALFTGDHSDTGFDDDGDGFYDYVLLTIPISFNESGWYELSGELFYDNNNWWEWIAWSSNHFEITTTGIQRFFDFQCWFG